MPKPTNVSEVCVYSEQTFEVVCHIQYLVYALYDNAELMVLMLL